MMKFHINHILMIIQKKIISKRNKSHINQARFYQFFER